MGEEGAAPLAVLVSPDVDLVALLADLLALAGFASSRVNDAREAVRVAAAWHPDVVVLDLEHQSLAGLARTLARAGLASLPLVLLLGRRPTTTSARGVRIVGTLHRPFTTGEFLRLVRQAAGSGAAGT